MTMDLACPKHGTLPPVRSFLWAWGSNYVSSCLWTLGRIVMVGSLGKGVVFDL